MNKILVMFAVLLCCNCNNTLSQNRNHIKIQCDSALSKLLKLNLDLLKKENIVDAKLLSLFFNEDTKLIDTTLSTFVINGVYNIDADLYKIELYLDSLNLDFQMKLTNGKPHFLIEESILSKLFFNQKTLKRAIFNRKLNNSDFNNLDIWLSNGITNYNGALYFRLSEKSSFYKFDRQKHKVFVDNLSQDVFSIEKARNIAESNMSFYKHYKDSIYYKSAIYWYKKSANCNDGFSALALIDTYKGRTNNAFDTLEFIEEHIDSANSNITNIYNWGWIALDFDYTNNVFEYLDILFFLDKKAEAKKIREWILYMAKTNHMICYKLAYAYKLGSHSFNEDKTSALKYCQIALNLFEMSEQKENDIFFKSMVQGLKAEIEGNKD